MKNRPENIKNNSYKKKIILFSGRDPGAVGHLLPIMEAFRRSKKFKIELLASGAAFDMLSQAGEIPVLFKTPDGRDHISLGEDSAELLDHALEMIRKFKPDIVFTSLSSFGVGVDEALLFQTQVPSFAMQEFWGDVNLGLGRPAGLYFVIDEYAANLTRARWGVEAWTVGAPKYTKYKDLNIHKMKWLNRNMLGIEDDEKVIGYFSQSPDIPGHEAVFNDFVKALKSIPKQPRLFLREHPKFHKASGEGHRRILINNNIGFIDVTNQMTTEIWLAVCDLVVTPFSLCGLDHAFLSAYSKKPIGSVLYLATNEKIRKFMIDYCGIERFPIVEKGIGKVVKESVELRTAIMDALEGQTIIEYFHASKSLLSGLPCQSIVRKVQESLGM